MVIDKETMQLIERIVARSIANSTSLKGAAGEIAKGVTQYVGARYVPLFAEPLEWDKTKAYEPLTIVLHQGNSYTSRQYVPVGVEIDNDSFWALTGNYNAQVEQYRQEVKTFDGRITANAQAIEKESEDRATAVTAEKTRAEGAEQTLQANIDAEKTRAEGAEQALDGRITVNTNNINKIKEACIAFDTLDSIDVNELSDGRVIKLLTRNGNFGCGYWVVTSEEPNNFNIVGVGTKAIKLIGDSPSIEQLGCPANGNATEYLKFALNNYNSVLIEGRGYTLSEQINIGDGKHLKGTHINHVGSKQDIPTFYWDGEYDNAAIAMFSKNPTSKFYDTYSQYGMCLENIAINGNNKLAMGFIVSGQQTSYASNLYATQCNIGIVFTRMWNTNIGHCGAYYCKLGFSTVPALSLDEDSIPNRVDGVDDVAVNNVNFSNLSAQDCENGLYIDVTLGALFDVIDVERCSGKYGLYLKSCNSLFNVGHFEEKAGVTPEDFHGVHIAQQYAKRKPIFGYYLTNSFHCEDICYVDTLCGYSKNTKFTGTSRPIVSHYKMVEYEDILDNDHSPIFNSNSFVVPGSKQTFACNNSFSVAIFNNGVKAGAGSVTVKGDDGKAETTIQIPTVPKGGTAILNFSPLYSTHLGGSCDITVTGQPSEYRFAVIGNSVG
jgi:hypothetical protein